MNNGNKSNHIKKIEKRSNPKVIIILTKHPLLFKQHFSPC